MGSKFRTLMIWLMLLALPLQGFAAAFMPFCESVGSSVHSVDLVSLFDHATAQNHEHAVVGEHHDHANHHAISHHEGGTLHSDAKCGTCAACCVGATMLSSDIVKLSFRPSIAERLSVALIFPLSIILATPERPPQISFV